MPCCFRNSFLNAATDRRLLAETPRSAGLEAFATGGGELFAGEAGASGNFEFGFGQGRCVGLQHDFDAAVLFAEEDVVGLVGVG